MWVEILVDVHVPELGRSFTAGEVVWVRESIARQMVANGYAVFTKRPKGVFEGKDD